MAVPLSEGDATVDITGKTVMAIKSAIDDAFTGATSGDTITVTGTGTVEFTSTLVLTIPAGVTLDWKAAVTGELSGTFMIAITGSGSGTFVVSSGGSITNTSTNSGVVIQNESLGIVNVSGGQVVSNAVAITNYSNGEIRVSGGTVKSAGIATAISNQESGKVTVSGGTVINTGTGTAINNYYNGTVTVSGENTQITSASLAGTIYQNDNGSTATHIFIQGGLVANSGLGAALYSASTSAVNISGGRLIAYSGYAVSNNYTGALIVTGGTFMGSIASTATPTNGTAPIYLITLTGLPVNTEITGITSPDGYGINDVKTDANGNLYFYLPEGDTNISLTADGSVYTGTVDVTTDHTATAALTTDPGAGTGTEITINNQSDWETLIGDTSVIPDSGGTIMLNANVTGNLNISSSLTDLTINGEGYGIGGGIQIAHAVNLTLKDLTVHPTDSREALSLSNGGALTTEGTVTLTGGDNTSGWAGDGVYSGGNLTITASNGTTFTGGNGLISAGAGAGVSVQNYGSLTLNGGSPQFQGGSGSNGYGVIVGDEDLIITAGSPTFTGGVTSGNYGQLGAYIFGDLIISSTGSPRFTGADGIGNNLTDTAHGAWVNGNFTISAGTPVFQGGAATVNAGGHYAGNGILVGKVTISGGASPTFTGGAGTANGAGGSGAATTGDVTVSTSGTAIFTAGTNQGSGLRIYNGTGGLDLTGLTGAFTATGGTKAFASATPSYPTGLANALKYNGTDASYTLDMTSAPTTVNIDNEADLKTALEETTSATITVTENITLTEAVTVGADHTLSIHNGKTLIIGDAASGSQTLNVPSGKTLTVTGDGMLSVENDQTNFGILVEGSMIVNSSNLTIKNSGEYTTGIFALNSLTIGSGCDVSIQNQGKDSCGIHVYEGDTTIQDSTVKIANIGSSGSGNAGIIVSSSLIIDNSTVAINSGGLVAVGIKSSGGNIRLKDDSVVTVDTTLNGIHFELNSGSLTVDGSTLELKSGSGLSLNSSDDVSFTGANGGTVKLVQGVSVLNADGKMKDQGSILSETWVTVKAEGEAPSATGLTAGDYVWDGSYFTKAVSGSTPSPLAIPADLTWDGATAKWNAVANAVGSAVQLYKGAAEQGSPVGVAGTEYDFTDTIAAAGAGSYTFKVKAVGDGTNWSDGAWSDASAAYVYTPGGGSVTGTMDVGGTTVSDLTQNDSGSGWAWDATSATLTLNSSYISSNHIFINCATTDTINLEYSGNVNISVADVAFNSKGALNINGSGALTLQNTTTLNCALQVINGDLNISSGTVVANGPIGIYTQHGDIIITGSANVTAVSTGINSVSYNAGIMTNLGYDIFITGGTVNATGEGTDQYSGALVADNITITSGDISLFADIPANYAIAVGGTLSIANGSVVKIGGAPIYLAALTLDGVNAVTTVSVVTAPTSGYGVSGRDTSASGQLFFLLPAGNQTVTLVAGGNTYTGTVNVTTNHAATATLMQQGGSGGIAPVITTTALPSGTVHTAYSQTLAATGTAPIEWSVASGALPDGLTLDANTGVISGTPTTEGVYGFDVKAQNTAGAISKTLSIQIYPAGTTLYSVTFDLNGGTRTGGGELMQTVASGGSATAPTVTRSSYTFTGWDKAFTNVTSNLTVKANWSYNGGGGGGNGGGSSSGSSTSVITPGKTPNQPVTAAAPVTATAGQNGSASASIPEKSITDAIAKAQADARAQGKTANGISVALDITMPKGATSLTTTLTQNSLNSLVSVGVTSVELNGAPVSLGLDLAALKEIQKQSGGNITISITPATGLAKEARALIGNRPVYNITISTMKDEKNTNVTSLGNGTATLSIPYTPGKNEAVGYLFGVYVEANGKATRIDGSAYDVSSRCVVFTTTHFTLYGVGYTPPSSIAEAGTSTQRLAGDNRYATAATISAAGWEQADRVILAGGENFPDALAGTVLAGLYQSPILLSSRDNLSPETRAELKRLQAQTVYILGGPGVIAPNIEQQLAQDYTVKRIAGDNRYATAVEIGQLVRTGTDNGADATGANTASTTNSYRHTAILVTGENYPDALSIASLAGQRTIPILFTSAHELNTLTRQALAEWDIQTVLLCGGSGVLSESIATTLEEELGLEITRLAGDNRYLTALAIAQYLEETAERTDTPYAALATGENYPDALAGAALAVKLGMPVLLTGQSSIDPAVQAYLKELEVEKLYLFGGTGAISAEVGDEASLK